MTTWVLCVFCAPPIGVVVSGFAIPVLGWRFSMWEILIASAPILILLLLLPETSSATILHRRARRLEHINNDSKSTTPSPAITQRKFRTEADIAQGDTSFAAVVRESLLIPSKITLLDPAILFLNCYTSLTYGIFYSFFEAFPIVYQGIYGFNLGEMGLAFLVSRGQMIVLRRLGMRMMRILLRRCATRPVSDLVDYTPPQLTET
ncbi:uncharacterized protein BDV14DRAFT_201267 [Aspergillus stella-maris]|uniref:uncharacterized protein n=1 Tax=Aspergillus stella-maris TaxID=1810926 RepID=UPI003CCD92FE